MWSHIEGYFFTRLSRYTLDDIKPGLSQLMRLYCVYSMNSTTSGLAQTSSSHDQSDNAPGHH